MWTCISYGTLLYPINTMFGIACLALRPVRISESNALNFGKPPPPVYYFQDIYFRGDLFGFTNVYIATMTITL